jgi:hypothetical protein
MMMQLRPTLAQKKGERGAPSANFTAENAERAELEWLTSRRRGDLPRPTKTSAQPRSSLEEAK